MPQVLPQVLSEDEVVKVLDSASNQRDKAILEFLYSTGARKEEALAIKLADINLTNQCVRLLGKGNKERLIPVGNTAIEAIGTYLKELRPQYEGKASNNALWLTQSGIPMSATTLDQVVRRLKQTTGISFSPHTLRRSCATHLLNNGASPTLPR